MIYVCIPSFNEAPTVGLLLWRVRQVFTDFPREYRLLVADDASSDATPEILAPYTRALPLTVVRHTARRGAPAAIEALLRMAVADSDRPKRDCAIVLHADFSHQPTALPGIVRAIDGGADLVPVEGDARGIEPTGARLLRRHASLVLACAVQIPGVRDLVSGYFGARLATVKAALGPDSGPALRTQGWAARVELLARLAAEARRIDTVTAEERFDLRQREARGEAWPEALRLWRARGVLRKIPRSRAAVASGDRSVAIPRETAADAA